MAWVIASRCHRNERHPPFIQNWNEWRVWHIRYMAYTEYMDRVTTNYVWRGLLKHAPPDQPQRWILNTLTTCDKRPA